ncbi:MAG: 3-oxoacyl-[acyl-carrier-protein] reductase [Candidatus Omnitrophota bacterium]
MCSKLLEGKTALITGGARGIGKAIAETFAKEGCNVNICDVSEENLKIAQAEMASYGVEVNRFVLDVTNLEQVEKVVNNILDKLKKIDILVNNAGITKDALLIRMNEEDWDLVINVNLKGTFNCSKAVSKSMMKNRSGKIVNIASIIGLMGNAGQANYAASKAGVIGITKTLAKELGLRNVNVNAIAPGFIQTHMTAKLTEDITRKMLEQIPLGRFGSASDVANMALFLATSASDYITGQVFQVDGGMLM